MGNSVNELIDQIGGRDRLEQMSQCSDVTKLFAYEMRHMARALLAVMDAQEKPFMYAISDCDGQAHFDEACVSAQRCDLEDVVGSLNEFRDDVDDGYSIVPVYTVPPAASVPDGWKLVPIEPTIEMREAYHQAEEDFQDCCGTSPDSHWAAMLAAAPAPGGDGE